MGLKVAVTDLRPRLTEMLGQVEFGDTHVKITRHGKLVGVIVPPMEFRRMYEAAEDEVAGARDPESGRRPGNALIRLGDKLGMARRKKLESPPPEGRARNWFWHW